MLRSQVGWLGLCALLVVSAACGRVGLHLIPIGERSPRRDAGSTPNGDAGTSNADGSVADGGGEGGGANDAMTAADAMMSEPPDAGMSCPTVCENEHGSADCSGGSCALMCEIGYADCDGVSSNGCELSTITSITSCGGCGRSCSNVHGSVACA